MLEEEKSIELDIWLRLIYYMYYYHDFSLEVVLLKYHKIHGLLYAISLIDAKVNLLISFKNTGTKDKM